MKSVNLICSAVIYAGLTASPAFADTWSGAYDNTIVSTYTDGRTVKVFVAPDHSYFIVLADGSKLKGTWTDGGGQSCFTVTDPPPAPGAKPVCFPLKEYKVGDTFEGSDATGSFKSVIQAGR